MMLNSSPACEVENSMNTADEDEDGDGATPSVSSKAATARTARSGRCGGWWKGNKVGLEYGG